jgi:hypothetical protein
MLEFVNTGCGTNSGDCHHCRFKYADNDGFDNPPADVREYYGARRPKTNEEFFALVRRWRAESPDDWAPYGWYWPCPGEGLPPDWEELMADMDAAYQRAEDRWSADEARVAEIGDDLPALLAARRAGNRRAGDRLVELARRAGIPDEIGAELVARAGLEGLADLIVEYRDRG